jgi:hypothetical protein
LAARRNAAALHETDRSGGHRPHKFHRRKSSRGNALDGMSRERAAHQAGMDRQTLRDWVIRFNAAGIDGLRDRPRSGRPPFLDEGPMAALNRHSPAPPSGRCSAMTVANSRKERGGLGGQSDRALDDAQFAI